MSESTHYKIDTIDKMIINTLQKGFPISPRPYQEAGNAIGISEVELIRRIDNLLQQQILSRFGPMYDAERFGGGLSLVAMQVPEAQFEETANYLNNLSVVAHNYQREHQLNMWFVLATEEQGEIAKIILQIEKDTQLKVYDMPKLQTFYINLYLPV